MALSSTILALAVLATASLSTSDGLALPFSMFPAAVTAGFDTSDSLYRVFRNAADFLDGWPRSSNCDRNCAEAIIAAVDFARNMLVVIAPRDRGQETYDVVVTAVIADGKSVDVSFLELRHGKSRGEVLCGVILTVPQP